jgi:hypothetical protein
VIDFDATLGQQFFDIAVGEPIAQGTSEPQA